MENLIKNEEIDIKSFADKLMKYHNQFRKIFPINRLRGFSLSEIYYIINQSLKTNSEYIPPLIEGNKKKIIFNSNISYLNLINDIRSNMSEVGYDYNLIIKEYNGYVKLRKQGHVFAFNEHLKAIIMVQLYNDRWGDANIRDNLDRIRVIFKNYDKDLLKKEDPNDMFNKLSKIHCTNPSTKKILDSLKYNIEILEQIENDYGSLEDFVESDKPLSIVNMLCDGKYKLKQIGIAGGFEYLQKVGIETTKPSTSLKRLLGNERLAFINNSVGTRNEILYLLEVMENETNVPKEEISLILWQFCIKSCANICTPIPKCNLCKLKKYCNYNNKNDK